MFEIIGMFTVTFIVIYAALGPLFKKRKKIIRLKINDVNIQYMVNPSYPKEFIQRLTTS